jgi:hypothetical protein
MFCYYGRDSTWENKFQSLVVYPSIDQNCESTQTAVHGPLRIGNGVLYWWPTRCDSDDLKFFHDFFSFSFQHVRSSQIIPVSNCLPGKRCEREKGSPKLSPWNITVVRVAGVYSASATKKLCFPENYVDLTARYTRDLEVVITLWTRFHVLTLGAAI